MGQVDEKLPVGDPTKLRVSVASLPLTVSIQRLFALLRKKKTENFFTQSALQIGFNNSRQWSSSSSSQKIIIKK
jgi:hypothetical protein